MATLLEPEAKRSTYRPNVEQYQQMMMPASSRKMKRLNFSTGSYASKCHREVLHDVIVERLSRRFSRLLPDAISVRSHSPVQLDDGNMPEPDLVLCCPPELRLDRHHQPHQIYLVIEVSNSSLQQDRTMKSVA